MTTIGGNGAGKSKVHDPTARPLECPFQAAAVPVETPNGRSLAFVRSPCGAHCALYDRVKDRPCIERVLEALAERRPAPGIART